MISLQDLRTRGLQRAYTSGAQQLDVTSGVAIRVMGMLITADASTRNFNIFNSTDASGVSINIRALGNESKYISFAPNGVRFGNGLSINATTAEMGIVFYLED